MKKIFLIIAIFTLIICVVNIISSNNTAFEVVAEKRENILDNHELIRIEKNNNFQIIHSVAQINEDNDTAYCIDIVKKNFWDYKWVFGGFHIDRFIPFNSRDFNISAQLINHKEYSKLIIFGVCMNKNIESINVKVHGDYKEAKIYDALSKGERYYVVDFDKDKVYDNSYIFEITYLNGDVETLVIKDEKINSFKKGSVKYFYSDKIW